MSKIEMLRELIKERLTSAAEEIFEVFGRTIVEYEEELCHSNLEIDRQRRLLALSRKPEIKLDRIAVLPDPHEWSSSLGSEDPEPPQVKEEQEEQEELQGVGEEELLQGLGEFPFYQTKEGDPRPGTSTERAQGEADGEVCGSSELAGGCRLTSPDCPVGESSHGGLPAGRKSYCCTTCGIDFVQRGHWARHMRAHKLGELDIKSYKCEICGKRLTRLDGFQKHMRVHTGEKPYCCSVCGKRFSDNSNYKRHMRTHSAEKLQPCSDCGKRFDSVEQLTAHMASHHVSPSSGNDS